MKGSRKQNPLVSVVILTHNRKRDVLEALNSLKKQSYKNYETILVDNASTDGTVEAVKKSFPKVKLVLNKENRMAIARNDGIPPSKGEYILFVDSDNVFDPEMISELIKLAVSDPTIGFVGPKMYYHEEPEVIWYAGADISEITGKTKYTGIGENDKGQYDKVKPVGHIPNLFMVKREVIDKIGGLDETFVMTYAESDFPMRASKAGFKILFCPTAKTWHKTPVPGKSKNPLRGFGFESPKRAYYYARNRVMIMKKHASSLNFYIFLAFLFPIYNLYFVLQSIKFLKLDMVNGYIRGILDGYRYGLFGTLKNYE